MGGLTAIIGGTGLSRLHGLEVTGREVVYTPFGEPSSPVTRGTLGGSDVVFIARHGYGHTLAPHQVNYRANLWALKSLGVGTVIAVNSVGGIRQDLGPGALVSPHQIIDYTYGRENTFFEPGSGPVTHIDFTHPYSDRVRAALTAGAAEAGQAFSDHAVYGATQGPRLETAAEVDRLERDGCDIVGMTGMPETALARELELEYACCAVVVNRAAGRGDEAIHDQLRAHLAAAMRGTAAVLGASVPRLR